MKKTITAAALLAALTFVGIQTVSAHGGRYFSDENYGPGYCGNYYNNTRGYTKEDQATFDKFRNDTATTRKEIVVKQSELDALMRQDNPDETKVAKLTSELYDLQTDLDKKAEAAGVDSDSDNYGPGMMRGYGWGPGQHMMGNGWGPGRHMMGW
jgi:Spy/CpxP family protein refolding chaperone